MGTSPIMTGEPFDEDKTTEIIDAFYRDGFVHIPGVLDEREMEALRKRTDELLDDPELAAQENLDLHDTRYVQMHVRSGPGVPFILRNTIALDAIFRDMLLREPILSLAKATGIGDDTDGSIQGGHYWLWSHCKFVRARNQAWQSQYTCWML